MNLQTIDWLIIAAFFAISLFIGLRVARKAGSSAAEYFASGRSMPWWLLGVSMVATTFSADTPNLVTGLVRDNGVAGNWAWWAFLLTGMLTVFVYAKLWRRSKVLTDLEFYEIRYSGKPAAFLRGFRAIYLGVFFNVMIMATVCLAGIKLGGVMGVGKYETILLISVVTVIYSSLGGLRGVLITDFVQFGLAMVGTIAAAIYIVDLPEVGGINNLLTHEAVKGKLSLLPDFNNSSLVFTVLIMPLAVQWWSVWYPGAEPGGGGYIAQRMLSAKDEKNAMGATLLFNAAHYALRPWPWILIALASLIVFPNLESLQSAFPDIPQDKLGQDLAYPAMLTYLPTGLIGLVLASLFAAVLSTLSTHLNWGSSYVVNDFYQRFVKSDASEKELVNVGRLSTLGLMVLGAIFALFLTDALQAFNILLQIGAGTGLLFILRWFWWRINAWSEITAMAVSFAIALFFAFIYQPLFGELPPDHVQLISGVAITTVAWVLVTLLSRPTEEGVLRSFFNLIKPAGPGWDAVLERAKTDGQPLLQPGEESQRGNLPLEILCMFIGCITVYSALFATGYWIYGKTGAAAILTSVAAIGVYVLFRVWGMLRVQAQDE